MENNDLINIRSCMDCNCKNVVYCINCHCGKSYIGETSDFRGRVNLHKQQILEQEYRHLYASEHLFECGNKWKIMPIFQMRYSDHLERQFKERTYIEKYKPTLNR